MKSALFFLLTCALTLGACSDRDPVSANEPIAALGVGRGQRRRVHKDPLVAGPHHRPVAWSVAAPRR